MFKNNTKKVKIYIRKTRSTIMIKVLAEPHNYSLSNLRNAALSLANNNIVSIIELLEICNSEYIKSDNINSSRKLKIIMHEAVDTLKLTAIERQLLHAMISASLPNKFSLFCKSSQYCLMCLSDVLSINGKAVSDTIQVLQREKIIALAPKQSDTQRCQIHHCYQQEWILRPDQILKEKLNG